MAVFSVGLLIFYSNLNAAKEGSLFTSRYVSRVTIVNSFELEKSNLSF